MHRVLAEYFLSDKFMNNPFSLRKMTASDKAEFISMSRDFYSSDAVFAPVPESFHEQAFDEIINGSPYADCLFFVNDGKVAGYALMAFTYSREAGGKCVWADELYIKPEYRGSGAAKYFFSMLPSLYPAARYRLEVEPDNVRAKKLYASQGFNALPYEQMKKGD